MITRVLAALGLSAVLAAKPSHAQDREPNVEPDLPVNFGYKMAWFAIRTTDTGGIAEAFRLSQAVPANWASGVGIVRREADAALAFVAPPVEGWTLVVTTLDIAAEDQDKAQKILALLSDLSRQFGEALHFGTYRVVDYHAWFHARDGAVTRAFSWCPETEGIVVNIGATTEAERARGLGDLSRMTFDALLEAGDQPDPTARPPTEEDVVELAAVWSVDPLTLDLRTDATPSVGVLGTLPHF